MPLEWGQDDYVDLTSDAFKRFCRELGITEEDVKRDDPKIPWLWSTNVYERNHFGKKRKVTSRSLLEVTAYQLRRQRGEIDERKETIERLIRRIEERLPKWSSNGVFPHDLEDVKISKNKVQKDWCYSKYIPADDTNRYDMRTVIQYAWWKDITKLHQKIANNPESKRMYARFYLEDFVEDCERESKNYRGIAAEVYPRARASILERIQSKKVELMKKQEELRKEEEALAVFDRLIPAATINGTNTRHVRYPSAAVTPDNTASTLSRKKQKV